MWLSRHPCRCTLTCSPTGFRPIERCVLPSVCLSLPPEAARGVQSLTAAKMSPFHKHSKGSSSSLLDHPLLLLNRLVSVCRYRMAYTCCQSQVLVAYWFAAKGLFIIISRLCLYSQRCALFSLLVSVTGYTRMQMQQKMLCSQLCDDRSQRQDVAASCLWFLCHTE